MMTSHAQLSVTCDHVPCRPSENKIKKGPGGWPSYVKSPYVTCSGEGGATHLIGATLIGAPAVQEKNT